MVHGFEDKSLCTLICRLMLNSSNVFHLERINTRAHLPWAGSSILVDAHCSLLPWAWINNMINNRLNNWINKELKDRQQKGQKDGSHDPNIGHLDLFFFFFFGGGGRGRKQYVV
jgi:hypothetical protein